MHKNELLPANEAQPTPEDTERHVPPTYKTEPLDVRNLAEANPELMTKLDKLGLENMHFEVYVRTKGPENSTEGPKTVEEASKVYVLLHGWTGTHDIFTQIKNENGLTMVEEILKRDPNAIIITPDGNGFGGTTFKKDIPTTEERIRLSTPEAYADQIEFLLKDVLEFDSEGLSKVRIVGHSMGGACAYEMARRGYEAVAVAPAALPTMDELRKVHDQFPVAVDTGLYDNLAHGVRPVYTALGLANQAAGVARERSSIPSEKIVQEAFEHLLADYLMGRKHPGKIPPDINSEMIHQLTGIHYGELSEDKLMTVAATMFALAEGVSLESWTDDEIKTFGNKVQAVFLGENDNLVKKKDSPDFQKAIAARLLSQENPDTQREGADISVELNQLTHLVKNAGHYATLYQLQVIDAIVAPSKSTIRHAQKLFTDIKGGNLEEPGVS